MLKQFIDHVLSWVQRFPETTLSEPGRGDISIHQHQDLIDAIRLRDADGAERIAQQHMRDAEAIRIAMLAKASPSVLATG